MARDKTDKTDTTPAATLATTATQAPKRYNRGKDGTHPLDKSYQPKPEGVVEELGGDELQRVFVTWGGGERLGKPDDFWNMLEATLAECDEIMLRHGWDRSLNNWPTERTSEPFSDLYYAGKIGFLCWNFLVNHRPGDPNTAMLGQAIRLGCAITEQEWRQNYKPSIITGAPVKKGGKLGGEMRAGKFAPFTAKVIEEMRRLNEQGHSVKRAAELVAGRGMGTSAGANRKLWQRHKSR